MKQYCLYTCMARTLRLIDFSYDHDSATAGVIRCREDIDILGNFTYPCIIVHWGGGSSHEVLHQTGLHNGDMDSLSTQVYGAADTYAGRQRSEYSSCLTVRLWDMDTKCRPEETN